MRVARLSRLAYARLGSRTRLTSALGLSRSPILEKVQVRPNGSPGIRLLASLAAEPVVNRNVQSNVPQSTLNGNVTSDGLRLQLEAVDELLRSGIGGSDLWTERLQGVKDDLKVQRPRRIAGRSVPMADAEP